jgi:flagellar biosynthetic protein FlhB
MAGGRDNKSEKPTRRRLEKARERGQVTRSKEVPAAAVFFGGLLVLLYYGGTILHALEFELRHLLNFRVPSDFTVPHLSAIINSVGLRVALFLTPMLLAVLVFSLAANILQGGVTFSTHSLGFHFERLSPRKGLNRVFSKNGMAELIKILLLLGSVSFISYRVLSKHIALYPRLVLMDARNLLYWTVSISFEICIRIALALIVLAVADYCFQRYRFTEQLKMTKQELKEEIRETEGDPIIKGRIRRIHREMARRRAGMIVPNSDVLILNPARHAVSLSYRMDSMDAPKVVAKGVGFLALTMQELAQKHGIPVVENKPLAAALCASVGIGEHIPDNLYCAVAELLAHICKSDNSFRR